MTRKLLSLVALSLLAVTAGSARVSAAPIDIIARLNPGQTGPIYAWSLFIRTDPGYDVGAIDLLTSGLDSMVLNPLNLGISPDDTVYVTDATGDGRNGLVLNNTAFGVAISAPDEEVLLATFYGPNRTSPPVLLWDGEYAYGGTAFDTYLNARPPEEVSLSAYPRALISLVVVPEPSHLAALAVFAVLALRTARRLRA